MNHSFYVKGAKLCLCFPQNASVTIWYPEDVCPVTDQEAFKKPEEDRMWTHIIMLVLLIFLYPRKADQLWALDGCASPRPHYFPMAVNSLTYPVYSLSMCLPVLDLSLLHSD